jgi:hypothetical protein
VTQRKTFELKEISPAGELTAVIATLDVKDRDRDVTRRGFFGTQPTPIVGSHDWDDIMLGKGQVSDADGRQAILEGRLNLDDPAGKALHSKLRFDLQNPPPLIEWSYAFEILEGGTSTGIFEGAEVRFLQPRADGSPGVRLFEASPVLVGAGVGTGTLTVKGLKRALAVHHTGTEGGAWDGPAAVASAPAEAGPLRAIHAWVDPDGDPDAKGSYKFPHHATPGGPANLTACTAGIAVLNGGRGGADIPDTDRQGVYNHLAAHLRDGDREPPELRSAQVEGAQKFVDQVDAVLADVDAALTRAEAIRAIRTGEGKNLGVETLELLTRLDGHLKRLAAVLTAPPVGAPLAAAQVQYEMLARRLHT